MSEPQTALGAEDYGQLLSMLTSEDPSLRERGGKIAAKLTDAEHKAFFEFQQEANTGRGEANREDATIGGVPPELAVTGAIGVARAAAGAAGSGLAGPTVAGLKELISRAAPTVKYAVMTHFGVPWYIALPLSGVRRGGAVKAAEGEAATAAEAPVPKPADPNAPWLDTTRLVRPGQLTQEQLAQREAYGRPFGPGGPARASTDYFTPRDAAAAATRAAAPSPVAPAAPVVEAPAAAPPAAPPPPAPSAAAAGPEFPDVPAAAGKILKQMVQAGLSPQEANEAYALIRRGMTPAKAWEQIQAARALAKSSLFSKLPTAADVAESVAERNARGRWPE